MDWFRFLRDRNAVVPVGLLCCDAARAFQRVARADAALCRAVDKSTRVELPAIGDNWSVRPVPGMLRLDVSKQVA